jgi:hypothetical protein
VGSEVALLLELWDEDLTYVTPCDGLCSRLCRVAAFIDVPLIGVAA